MKGITKIILWVLIISDVIIVLLDKENMSPMQRYFPQVESAIVVNILFVLAQLAVYRVLLLSTVRAQKDLVIPALLFRIVSTLFVICYSLSLFLAVSFKDTGMMKEF